MPISCLGGDEADCYLGVTPGVTHLLLQMHYWNSLLQQLYFCIVGNVSAA